MVPNYSKFQIILVLNQRDSDIYCFKLIGFRYFMFPIQQDSDISGSKLVGLRNLWFQTCYIQIFMVPNYQDSDLWFKLVKYRYIQIDQQDLRFMEQTSRILISMVPNKQDLVFYVSKQVRSRYLWFQTNKIEICMVPNQVGFRFLWFQTNRIQIFMVPNQ